MGQEAHRSGTSGTFPLKGECRACSALLNPLCPGKRDTSTNHRDISGTRRTIDHAARDAIPLSRMEGGAGKMSVEYPARTGGFPPFAITRNSMGGPFAMGRPRKPTALKIIAGTANKHGAAGRNDREPEPLRLQGDQLDPPPHLHERSASVWREVAPMLWRVKVLTEADVIALEMLCDAVADYRFARVQRGDSFVTTSGKTGAEMLGQWLVAQQMSSKRAESFMSRFGMDPASRSKLVLDVQPGLFDDPGSGGGKGVGRFFR